MKNALNTPNQSSITELNLELLSAVAGGGYIEQESGPDFASGSYIEQENGPDFASSSYIEQESGPDFA